MARRGDRQSRVHPVDRLLVTSVTILFGLLHHARGGLWAPERVILLYLWRHGPVAVDSAEARALLSDAKWVVVAAGRAELLAIGHELPLEPDRLGVDVLPQLKKDRENLLVR